MAKYKPDPSEESSIEWVMRQFWRISTELTALADSIALGSEGRITVEDEGTPLTTTADTLNFVGLAVDATGTGTTKTITISGAGGSSGITVEDEGTPLTTTADTLDFVGGGVVASGTGATKTITVGNDYLNKDTTSNVTVGYTCDIEAVSISSGTLTPIVTLEHLKTLSVGGSFTLGVPGPAGKNGFCEFRVSVTGAGPWTITKGTNVELVGTDVTLTSGSRYVLNIRKYSDTDCVAQLNVTG